AILDAIDREHAAERPLGHDAVVARRPGSVSGRVHDGDGREGADRAGAVVVRDLVAGLEVVQGDALAAGDHGPEDAVTRKERGVSDVVRAGRELADPEVRAGVVEPEENSR